MPQKLPPQPWMATADTRAVMAALLAEGGAARFVGGCVRDAVLGRPVKDIDIATPLLPEQVMSRLQRAGLAVVPTGLQHGTVTAIANHKPFEITTLRRDVETFGRHARVEFTDDWQADAARRDLTMNALSADADGHLFDYFKGLADLAEGRVRFVGAASLRIAEDYLRLLRFFRFHAHYGSGPPDAEGLAAATALAPQLATISAERKRDELLKLLAAPNPLPVLAVMRSAGVLAQVLPLSSHDDVLTRLLPLFPEAPLLLRLAALLPAEAEAARSSALALRLSNDERQRLVSLAEPPVAFGDDALSLRRACYRLGADLVDEVLILRAARAGTAMPEAARGVVKAWLPVTLPLQGRDLLAMGLAEPGPALGQLLTALEAWWIAEDFRPDRAACETKARALTGR